MTPDFLHALETRTAAIHARWRELLHVSAGAGPLGHPDTLAHLVPEALAQVFERLAATAGREPMSPPALLPACDCGNNPYLVFYVAGEQALTEAVLRARSGPASAGPERATAVKQVIHVVRGLALQEIDGFCGICMHRGRAAKCRHAVVACAG